MEHRKPGISEDLGVYLITAAVVTKRGVCAVNIRA